MVGDSRKEIQIDIVSVPAQESNQKIDRYLIGPCKFKNEKTGTDEARLLEHYADVFGMGKSNTYYFVLFSLSGFTEECKTYAKDRGMRLVVLDEGFRRV